MTIYKAEAKKASNFVKDALELQLCEERTRKRTKTKHGKSLVLFLRLFLDF